MTRLTWGDVGTRFYETGADRGVLYLPGEPGVVWNGLTAVKESVSGGEPSAFYLDGIKYLNVAAAEDFQATLEALSAPSEFGVCDGTAQIANGLFITHQPRKTFGLSYRTKIGNDVDGVDHAYKLHLVYNCLAAPSERNNSTISDTLSPLALSWSITTVPKYISGNKPTAHLILDSRLIDPEDLEEIENLLYGTDIFIPSLPSPDELVEILT